MTTPIQDELDNILDCYRESSDGLFTPLYTSDYLLDKTQDSVSYEDVKNKLESK